ncbi:hypothetical protein ONS95_003110 [Cadophora gregata]|uniref:uncharacterized protein n=1 Tax=Cadophora gregata TaxID=51156 RepID=UPI0026DC7CCE|nr:uncharacterized protein ONS95_003110 [Cadophora gregata]KAK0108294.1 hypothetical protein ONS95_003110 [Cadophora gregata]
MASKILSIVGSTLPLVFGILSLSFVAVSFTSRDWVRQEYFPPQLQPLDWKDPLFTLYRSPFVVCGASPSRNGSEILRYDINCSRFAVSGRGKTACQTPNETDAYSSITGDWRMCQQIHLSGNLVLAALVFVSVALATLIGLSIVFIPRAVRGGQVFGTPSDVEDSMEGSSRRPQKATAAQTSVTTSTQQPIQSLAIIIATYALLVALSVTAMCTFLSQFYGILGLIQSQPDNGLWASLSLGAVQDQQTGDLHHAPWIQGNVLTIYMSLAWLFSALAAGAIGGSWLSNFNTRT